MVSAMKGKTFERVLWDVARRKLRERRKEREQHKTYLLVSLRENHRSPQFDSAMEMRE